MLYCRTDLRIAYIGGGSRGWAWALMSDLAMEGSMGGRVALYDINKPAAEKNAIIGNRFTALPGAAGKWEYLAVNTLEEALSGADFVIISILPGTFQQMQADVHMPEQYGIYQSVGDTVGPGGIIRSLRTVPIFAEIARAIKATAPDAWVINYTNPMAISVRTLYEVFPGIKAFGCCHEVFGTQELLCAMLKDMLGIDGAARGDIDIGVAGLNHFTWITRASYRDLDLFPTYRRFAEKYHESGFAPGGAEQWNTSVFSCAHRVKFDLFRRYGAIAAAGDRHLAEFCPPWYLKDRETVKRWMFNLTSVEWRLEDMRRKMERSERLVSGEEPVQPAASGEEGVPFMKALLGMGNAISNVNLPNRGQIANLPAGTAVETNACLARDHISPMMAGSLPSGVLGLTMPHAINQSIVIQAGLSGDRELAFQAFANDPLVHIGIKDARALFDSMTGHTIQEKRT